jgi:hypothetical protein
MHPRTRTLASLAFAAGLLAAAAPARGQEIRYGPDSALGGGAVRSYLILNADQQPVELGVAIDESVLGGLPDLADAPPEESFILLDLELPEGNPTPYRLASIDWNPKGHPPVMYGIPHFDFHFYLIDAATRDAIVAPDPAALEAVGSKAPEAGLLPGNYVYPGEATVPKMGAHWIDPASHEFHGETFDRTYIYGTWDGQVIFHEPMITRAFIESRPDALYEIVTPERYETAGWYPSAYRVGFDAEAGQYRIALMGFAQR